MPRTPKPIRYAAETSDPGAVDLYEQLKRPQASAAAAAALLERILPDSRQDFKALKRRVGASALQGGWKAFSTGELTAANDRGSVALEQSRNRRTTQSTLTVLDGLGNLTDIELDRTGDKFSWKVRADHRLVEGEAALPLMNNALGLIATTELVPAHDPGGLQRLQA